MTQLSAKQLCLGCKCVTDNARCDECKSRHDTLVNERDARRKTQADEGWSKRFYGSAAWRKCRRWVLADRPLCRACLKEGVETLAVDVHHIEPAGPTSDRNLDPTNLEPLCKRCHTRRENRERPKRRGSTTIECDPG